MSIGRVPGATGIQPSIVTAKGDLIVATASGSVTNQAVGSNNQVLTADSAQADGVKWANGSAATLTTTGDLLYASAANTPARLGIGSTDQVLKVSGGVPAWGAAPAASFVGCRAYNSAAQTISHNTDTLLTFDTESFDTDAFHSTSTNTGRMTIPSGKAGKYLVQAAGVMGSNTTGFRYMYIRKNGSSTQYSYGSAYAGGDWSMQINNVMDLAVGDYVEIMVYQGSGSSQTFDTRLAYGWFSVTYLGA